MISPTFYSRLTGKLSSFTFFTVEDFIITSSLVEDDDDIVLLNIQYLYNPSYSFQFSIDKTDLSEMSVAYNPGEILEMTYFSKLTDYLALGKIENWLTNIKSALTEGPLARKIMKNEQDIQEIHSKINSFNTEKANDFFSEEEAEDIKSRLKNLEDAFSEKLADEIKDENKLHNELHNLESEIRNLKIQVDALTKKNWFLAFSTKIYLWNKRNPETVRHLGGFTRELLPKEIQDMIPEETLDLLLPVPEESKKS